MQNSCFHLKSCVLALALCAFSGSAVYAQETATKSALPPLEHSGLPKYLRERVPVAGEHFKFFLPALSWRVKSITLNWDCNQEIRQKITDTIGSLDETENVILKSTGFRVENSSADSETSGSTSNAGVGAGIEFSFNPMQFVSSLLSTAKVGGTFDKSYSSETKHIRAQSTLSKNETGETATNRVRNYMTTVAEYTMSKELKNFNLAVEIEFTNNTDEKIMMDDFSVPVFSGEDKLGDAVEISKRQRQVLQPRRGKAIPLIFRCNLDNTRAIGLLSSGNISVDVAATSGTLTMPDRSDVFVDVLGADRKLFISDGKKTGVFCFRDDGKPHTVREFIHALNAQCSRFENEKVVVFDKFSPHYLASVCGNANDENGLWHISVPGWGNRVSSLDDTLPPAETVFICKTNRIKRSWLENGINKGDPAALYWMGRCWESGIDGARNEETAFAYFEKSAQKDFVPAQKKIAESVSRHKFLQQNAYTADLGNGSRLELLKIPAGTFTMGSPETESARSEDEAQVQVCLSRPFYLGKTEVTQAQWNALMESNPSYFKGETLPVENVPRESAAEFCRRLTERERAAGNIPSGWKYTLPTEAQWEYACRAGTTTSFGFGDSDRELYLYGNFGDKMDSSLRQDDGASETASVGNYRPNAWGLHDMHGNVWEWCADHYNAELPGGNDPQFRTENSGIGYVLRGGDAYSSVRDCRSAARYGRPDALDYLSCVGFRVALVSEQ